MCDLRLAEAAPGEACLSAKRVIFLIDDLFLREEREEGANQTSLMAAPSPAAPSELTGDDPLHSSPSSEVLQAGRLCSEEEGSMCSDAVLDDDDEQMSLLMRSSICSASKEVKAL